MNKHAVQVMGILNVTPDSFSDGGQCNTHEDAYQKACVLIAEGADVIDVGGESTRPGATPVSEAEELERTIPVIEKLASEQSVVISIDTRNATVMEAALQAGATMINDISALMHDERSLDVVAKSDASLCLMHMQGSPETMQNNPVYDDVVSEVYTFLEERVRACVAAGIGTDRLYVDPGIGFGKTLEHNLDLLRNINRFTELGAKVLLGTSRKGFIGALSGESDATKRAPGTLASLVPGINAGVDMVRVHDVAATKQFLDVLQAL